MIFWVSALYFPQSFFTGIKFPQKSREINLKNFNKKKNLLFNFILWKGIKQNYARKNKIAIDKLSFTFEVIDDKSNKISSHPPDGCYIDGLYLEGGRWNYETRHLDESLPGEIYDDFPVVRMITYIIDSLKNFLNYKKIWVIPQEKTKEMEEQERESDKMFYRFIFIVFILSAGNQSI